MLTQRQTIGQNVAWLALLPLMLLLACGGERNVVSDDARKKPEVLDGGLAVDASSCPGEPPRTFDDCSASIPSPMQALLHCGWTVDAPEGCCGTDTIRYTCTCNTFWMCDMVTDACKPCPDPYHQVDGGTSP